MDAWPVTPPPGLGVPTYRKGEAHPAGTTCGGGRRVGAPSWQWSSFLLSGAGVPRPLPTPATHRAHLLRCCLAWGACGLPDLAGPCTGRRAPRAPLPRPGPVPRPPRPPRHRHPAWLSQQEHATFVPTMLSVGQPGIQGRPPGLRALRSLQALHILGQHHVHHVCPSHVIPAGQSSEPCRGACPPLGLTPQNQAGLSPAGLSLVQDCGRRFRAGAPSRCLSREAARALPSARCPVSGQPGTAPSSPRAAPSMVKGPELPPLGSHPAFLRAQTEPRPQAPGG